MCLQESPGIRKIKGGETTGCYALLEGLQVLRVSGSPLTYLAYVTGIGVKYSDFQIRILFLPVG